ncbi:heavy-metal-associated domain-containing protein [Fodinibius sediminis]|uniref:heavy-metal-associated domain-containing protein n=1 Tax=Fodinibius sediminis TaxID=1214077 RepID=UPI00163D4A56|nr:heavy-metal-associated domain-containing protein [Fodinibius sediminis]
MDTAYIQIGEMGCSGCANTIQDALNSLNGVEKATVDLEKESAAISFNAGTVSKNDFERVISEAGYEFRGFRLAP